VNVTIEVPVKDIHLHMATCIESGYNWFRWREVEADETGNGYLRARVVLFDDSYKLAEYTREALKAVLPTLPDGAVIVDWRSGYPVFRFDHTDFIRGLKACAERGIGKGCISQVDYQGGGDWDIDANGADAIVQLALLGELVFG
jgi:hypothetical protein